MRIRRRVPAAPAAPTTPVAAPPAAPADPFDPLEEIAALEAANRTHPDPTTEVRLAALRHQAFEHLPAASAFSSWPVPASGHAAGPDVPTDDLTADAVREAIAAHGYARVPGLLSAEVARTFVEGIDHVLDIREANQDTPYRTHGSWYSALSLSPERAQTLGRPWIANAGGILACDAPKMLEAIFTTYEDLGLRRVVTDYLGERPVLSANKCTLRRVDRHAGTDWHQDGAFLGTGVRALNVWIALTDCGVDAPGLDLVPRRFEVLQETGTGGAIFDWAVGPDVVDRVSVDTPVIRPEFQVGDALLFDDLFLHRTAVAPTMAVPRYAIESWFFGATSYPPGQVPLVW